MNASTRLILALVLVAPACSDSGEDSRGSESVVEVTGGAADLGTPEGSGGLVSSGGNHAVGGLAGSGGSVGLGGGVNAGGTAAAAMGGALVIGTGGMAPPTGGSPPLASGGVLTTTGGASAEVIGGAGATVGGASTVGGAPAAGTGSASTSSGATAGAAAAGGITSTGSGGTDGATGGVAATGGSGGVGEPHADYTGYLFVYFTGESTADGEQIYMALSNGNSALSWQALGGGAPVLRSSQGSRGVRDPFIIRAPSGEGFYLIATDLKMYGSGDWDTAQRQGSLSIMVWESTDLVNWTDERLVRVAPDSAGNTWAPEAIYDDSQGEYVVFWASKIYAADDPQHVGSTHNRMMYARTADFLTFSEAAVWKDPGYSVIDSTVIEVGGVFYRFTKDERSNGSQSPCGKFVMVESSSSLTDTTWNPIAECLGQGTIGQGEGPLVFRSNTEEKWYLFIDEFGGRGYTPFESTDLATGAWSPSTSYSLPASPRHGTVLPVTADEYQRLVDAYGGS